MFCLLFPNKTVITYSWVIITGGGGCVGLNQSRWVPLIQAPSPRRYCLSAVSLPGPSIGFLPLFLLFGLRCRKLWSTFVFTHATIHGCLLLLVLRIVLGRSSNLVSLVICQRSVGRINGKI